MRTFRRLLPLLLGSAVLVAPGPAAAHAPAATVTAQVTTERPLAHAQRASKPPRQRPRFREYVALGDSWTADVVILNAQGLPATEFAPIDCAQSKVNYPRLLARALRPRVFRDASCGSATTEHFRRPQSGLPIGGTNRPQFDRLTRRTDLVTVGIGGNDAGIAAAALDCLNLLPFANPLPTQQVPLPELPIPLIGSQLPLGGCHDKYTAGGRDQLARQIRHARPKVVRALRAIQRISPRARVLLVDYMAVVPDHGCYPRLPATDEDMRYISAKFRQLNRMLARAARRAGAELVRTRKRTVGHDLCQGPRVRYAETLPLSVNDPAVGIPAHPNAAGARAQAASVLDHLRAHPRRPGR